MKRIILSIAMVVAFFFSATAQVKFAATPEVSIGYTKLPKEYGDNGALHLGLGASIGVMLGSDKASHFLGGYLSMDGYGFADAPYYEDNYGIRRDYYDEDVVYSLYTYTLGVSEYTRLDCGLTFGGVLGCKLWSDELVIDGESYDWEAPSSSFVAKGRVGYGFKHVFLLLEAGYDGGLSLGSTIAFPIYSSR